MRAQCCGVDDEQDRDSQQQSVERLARRAHLDGGRGFLSLVLSSASILIMCLYKRQFPQIVSYDDRFYDRRLRSVNREIPAPHQSACCQGGFGFQCDLVDFVVETVSKPRTKLGHGRLPTKSSREATYSPNFHASCNNHKSNPSQM